VACNGACVNLGTASNCLSCGNTCTAGVACNTSAGGCIVDYGVTSRVGFNQIDLISGVLHGQLVNVPHAINVLRLGMILNSGTNNGFMALYQADPSSGALNLLAATASASVSSFLNAPNTQAVTAPVVIQPGNYYVFVELQNADSTFYDTNTSHNVSTITVDFGTYGLSNIPAMNTSQAASQAPWPLWVEGAETP
jgi:hypothetical protein